MLVVMVSLLLLLLLLGLLRLPKRRTLRLMAEGDLRWRVLKTNAHTRVSAMVRRSLGDMRYILHILGIMVSILVVGASICACCRRTRTTS